MTADWRSWAALSLLVVCFGTAFAALKTAVADVDPVWVTALRLLIGTAALGTVLPFTGDAGRLPPLSLARGSAWRWMPAIGLVATVFPFLLFSWASTRLDSAVVAICNGGSPIFTALMAWVALREDKVTARRAAGVALGFAGLVVLVSPGLAGGGNVELMALLAAMAGAFLYAVGNIGAAKAPRSGAIAAAFMMTVSGAAAALAIALAVRPLPAPTPDALAAIAFLGLAPTAFAMVVYMWLLTRRGPVFTSMVTYLSPLWAMIIGVAVLGEQPGLPAFVALGLVLAGVWVANSTGPGQSSPGRSRS